MPDRSGPLLISDFDGTMTRHDFYQLVLERYPSPEAAAYWDGYISGSLDHFAALRGIFATLRASEQEIGELVRAMQLAPGLPEAVSNLQGAGWTIVVASAGCAWYIERLLEEAGLELTVHANPGRFIPAAGLQMTLPVDSRYCHPVTGIDKAAVVSAALAHHPRVAFAGDSRPDRQAAMLVQAGNRFACGWLAQHFTRQRTPYRQFHSWPDIVTALLE